MPSGLICNIFTCSPALYTADPKIVAPHHQTSRCVLSRVLLAFGAMCRARLRCREEKLCSERFAHGFLSFIDSGEFLPSHPDRD